MASMEVSMDEFIKRDWGYGKPVEIRKTLDGAVLIIPTKAGIVLKYLYGKFEDILARLPKCERANEK